MQASIERTIRKIKTLYLNPVSQDYSYGNIFIDLLSGVHSLQNNLTQRLVEALPKYRGNFSDSSELLDILETYHTSSFEENNIKMFLNSRNKGIVYTSPHTFISSNACLTLSLVCFTCQQIMVNAKRNGDHLQPSRKGQGLN